MLGLKQDRRRTRRCREVLGSKLMQGRRDKAEADEIEMVWACGVGLKPNCFGFSKNSPILYFHQFHYQLMSLGLDFGPKSEIINDTKSMVSLYFP